MDLPYAKFVGALKSALRDFRRPDRLADNPLMRSRLLAARGQRPADLQALLTETAAALFVSARDEKLRRVLDLTYFDATLKQEAAAERLGLPFGTYRRHLTAAVGRLARWLWEQERAEPTTPAIASPSAAAFPASKGDRPRLSLVVLPFVNFGGGPDQEYFVDGITESLTTDISRIPGIFVIARNTAFSYRGATIDARQIGRELGVRYVMEGSVQSSANRIRVNAQLIDAETGAHIWAERFDKTRKDVFDMQDEITARLARMVDVELVAAESLRAERDRPDTMDSIDLAMRGWAIYHRQLSPGGLRESRAMFEAALRLDDENVSALIGFAESHVTEVNAYASDARDEQIRAAEQAVDKALKLAPHNAHAHFCRAEVWSALRLPERALRELEVAIGLDRNYANAHAFAGITKVFLGCAEETEAHVAEAMRLSPRDPMLAIWHLFVGGANLHLNRIDRALHELQRSVDINPNDALTRFYLAAALALAGRTAEAAAAVAIGIARMPSFTIGRFRGQARSDNPQGLHATPRGTLRLNVSMMMPHLVNPVVDEFSALHPDAAIEMVISERLVDLVAQGFDLALHSAPIAESSLIVRRLAVDHMVICGAPDYFSVRGMPKHPFDLSHHNCLLFTPSPWAEEWPYRDEDGEHRVPVSGNLRSNSAVSLRLAALRGQGLLAAPSFYVAEDIAAGRLVPILAKHTQQEFPILAIYPHRHQVSAKVRSFIDLLARHLRDAPVRALHRPSRQAA